MKAKDLIKVLQALDPESSISFSLGHDDDYRETCAKAELTEGECLGYLAVDTIEFHNDDESMWCDIVLQQDNLCYLEEAAEQFDKQYQKVDEQPT